MEIPVEIGRMYAVSTNSSCTVSIPETMETLVTATSGQQAYFMAQSNSVIVSDDNAQVTRANFKGALIAVGGGGGNSAGGDNSIKLPPAGSVPVEYIESSGTQYIKTGYLPNQDTGLRSVHQQVTISNGRVAYTSDTSANSSIALGAFCRVATSGSVSSPAGGSRIAYGKRYDLNNTTGGWDSKQTSTVNYLGKRRAGSILTWPGNSEYAPESMSWSSQFFCSYELFLFGANIGGTLDWAYKGKIFELQISQGENVVRDYKPYVSKDGEPFMWDAVTGQVLKNAGSGIFRIGLATLEQVYTLMNALPYLSGEGETRQLRIRLEDDVKNTEVETFINNVGNTKNWEISAL